MPGHRALAAEPLARAASQQAPGDVGPARVRDRRHARRPLERSARSDSGARRHMPRSVRRVRGGKDHRGEIGLRMVQGRQAGVQGESRERTFDAGHRRASSVWRNRVGPSRRATAGNTPRVGEEPSDARHGKRMDRRTADPARASGWRWKLLVASTHALRDGVGGKQRGGPACGRGPRISSEAIPGSRPMASVADQRQWRPMASGGGWKVAQGSRNLRSAQSREANSARDFRAAGREARTPASPPLGHRRLDHDQEAGPKRGAARVLLHEQPGAGDGCGRTAPAFWNRGAHPQDHSGRLPPGLWRRRLGLGASARLCGPYRRLWTACRADGLPQGPPRFDPSPHERRYRAARGIRRCA